jgi:mannose-1-phosphate guanylyltransferase/mannose-1-phosphate guanylyltransferase/mannose-6-phosphate isomerase
MPDKTLILPVILSGGGGTRLWPLSTPTQPKQFLALTSEQTMFQLTIQRTANPDRYHAPMIVGNAAHAALVEEQLAAIGLSASAIVLEPCARNTAPAIALAALLAPSPETLMLIMPSDHVITDVPAFHAAIDAAAVHANEGWLATFGITPTGPETGYGYIEAGDDIGLGVKAVKRFVEKPDLARAEAMLAAGNHAWNGGIFLFRADAYLAELGAHAPEMVAAARQSISLAARDGVRVSPDAEAFAASPSDSIDYAVMEKAARVAMAPVAMGWSDVGSWDALYSLAERDSNGNASIGKVCVIDSTGCLVRGEGIKVGVIGVEDLIVVATADRVLVMPRSRAQDVRKLADEL